MEVTRPERSEPVRVISMKDQLGGAAAHRPLPAVKLRSLAEVSGRHPTPASLGRLAPPRNARESHARRVRSNVGWAGLALALAAAIALAIWLVAR